MINVPSRRRPQLDEFNNGLDGGGPTARRRRRRLRRQRIEAIATLWRPDALSALQTQNNYDFITTVHKREPESCSVVDNIYVGDPYSYMNEF